VAAPSIRNVTFYADLHRSMTATVIHNSTGDANLDRNSTCEHKQWKPSLEKYLRNIANSKLRIVISYYINCSWRD